MRTKLKKLTSVCLAVIMILSVLTVAPLTANAAETDSESVSEMCGDFECDFSYENGEKSSLSILSYNGSVSNLAIPPEIDGISVTGIHEYAFSYCTNLTNVTIPLGVGYIGEYAFSDCTSLTNVTIPLSVENIGEYAFGYYYDEYDWEYKKIDDFTICGYTNSEAEVYARKNGFTFISLGEISPLRYDLYDEKISIFGYKGSERNLIIPSTLDGYIVTEIGSSAFEDCTDLTSVIIPDSVTEICNGAFTGCTNLTSVTIPDGVTKIWDDAFTGCTSLTSVTIPESVEFIGSYAFGYVYDKYVDEDDIYELEYSKIDDFTIYGYTNSNAEIYARENGFTFISIGEVSPYLYEVLDDESVSIIDYNGSDTNLNIPAIMDGFAVKQIGASAFYNCKSLVSVTIPDSVTSIAFAAFSGCTSLENIKFSPNVTHMGFDVFDDTAWYINQPDGIVYAGNVVCGYKGEMPENTFVTLKPGTKGIAWNAFCECTNLVGITIPEGIKEIGNHTFCGCTSLTSIKIPDGVTKIGLNAFFGCTKLENVNIPDSVTQISSWAFHSCPNLKNVTIPNSVTDLNIDPFGYYSDGEKYAKVDGFTIYGYENSEAENYANENGFTFVALDSLQAGDVNGDGKISIDDVTDIQKHLANTMDFTEEQMALADVDKDGKVVIDDVTLIQKHLAGMAVIE